FEDRRDLVAEREIGEAHDAGGDARLSVAAAVAHRRDAGHELRLPHRTQLLRTRRAVHRLALDEDRGDDVVAPADVVEELVEQVAMPTALPEMMVRVDDGQVGLEDRLRRTRGEPRLVGLVDAPELRRTRSAHARA